MLRSEDENEALGLILPDIARESRVDLTGRLDQVGMTNIEIPILLQSDSGEQFKVPARADAFVSLDDPFAKGIHMSRLYLQLMEGLQSGPLTFEVIEAILKSFVASHVDLSESSYLKIYFEYMVQRPALKSQNLGWRSYPIVMSGSLDKGIVTFELEVDITYSSTCPCSAALARKLIQDHFRKTFNETNVDADEIYKWLGTTNGIIATPHSQRSVAQVKVKLQDPKKAPLILDIIDLVEKKLATPVQSAVKREDEQEFAYLNGQNLMFCEDAARKIKNSLADKKFIKDFWVRVNHKESLHPHNAVSVVTKGVKGGYSL
jgi:GTP cyclohydrolase I